MNLINEKEVSRLLEWATENENKDIFLLDKNHKETFWKEKESQDTYIMEYDFRTIPEFEKICNSVFAKKIDGKVQRAISVAAFKHSKDYEIGLKKKEKAEERLPEHIYVF